MLEIILAAVLTLLGLLILVILIVRWTLCRRNVARISRINSEQCAGLLDNEDGIASARRNKAGNAGHITGTIGPISEFFFYLFVLWDLGPYPLHTPPFSTPIPEKFPMHVS
ncbi:hypothetical protein LEMLEM_LOCUS14039 [Lemmus lemmus]